MVDAIVMPRLSDAMEEGTIIAWLKQIGEKIAVGEPVVEIETDKATIVYAPDVSGTLAEIFVADGESAAVGAVIARVSRSGTPKPGGAAVRTRREATPVARRMARDRGVDLEGVVGSGPGGRVVKADVERASGTPAAQSKHSGNRAAEAPANAASGAAPPRTSPAGEPVGRQSVRLTNRQRIVARRMSEAKLAVPHFYLAIEVDMTAAVKARQRLLDVSPRGRDTRPSLNDFVVKASAMALRDFPHVNGSFRGDHFELHSNINIGIAVAVPDALVVPVIRDADTKGLRAIALEARTLIGKVRDGSIAPHELADGTFTVSNLGMYGIVTFQPIVNPPQAAILGVGQVVERPVARRGELVFAHIMSVSLSCDHRILYGVTAADFLNRVRTILQEPFMLAL